MPGALREAPGPLCRSSGGYMGLIQRDLSGELLLLFLFEMSPVEHLVPFMNAPRLVQ